MVVEDTEDPLKTLKQSIARLDADLEIEESEAELAFDETPKGEPANSGSDFSRSKLEP